ncbi:glucan endo-1,3-beta-glucosidase 7 [Citrus sinensis]|uniref:Glucan endo-1,3-beta-glucosidase 7 n=1 Tax=Citrus sinensis TaxID=2711 RepID=A0ACB8KWD0_CITSI|nr:glucan endo-1,3-beta-glucosidase 7 [Citrus sinensis]
MAFLPDASLFILLNILIGINIARSEPFIGINYGNLGDNLPSPEDTVKLLQSTSIQKIRLYSPDIPMIKALANSGIDIVVGTQNSEIPALASDPNAAKTWINTNVLPFYPASNIFLIMVGNEISLDENFRKQLLPAMQNMQNALDAGSLGGKIKVSTVHSMSVLSHSDPPSSGEFQTWLVDVMKGFLGFNNATGSPFVINPYPYYAYNSDPRPGYLAYCLFQWLLRLDGHPKETTKNLGQPLIKPRINYYSGLITHFRSKAGTPLMPGKTTDTYLFALYDENLKQGPISERSFGLFKPDRTANFDVGLLKNNKENPGAPNKAMWCVPKEGVTDEQLQTNIDYACGRGIDCSPIAPGGACFEPDTLASHAAYAMNLHYQTNGRNAWDCDFSKTATLSSKDPSYKGCIYPSNAREAKTN